jgi:hypothetical protein
VFVRPRQRWLKQNSPAEIEAKDRLVEGTRLGGMDRFCWGLGRGDRISAAGRPPVAGAGASLTSSRGCSVVTH